MNGQKIYVLHRSKTEIHIYEVRSLRTVGMSRAVGGVNKDILNYTYTNGNQLGNVTDAGDITSLFKGKAGGAGYTYDVNGNMTADNNKDLTVNYNYLNLPGAITRTAGATGYVKNYYAGATKIRSVTYTAATNKTKTYDYMAGMVYAQEDALAPKTLDFVATPEGRAMSTKTLLGLSAEPLTGDKFRYEYNLKDHLGNLRVSCRCDEIKRDANGLPYPETDANYGFIPLKAVQEIAYDPWGLNFGNTTDSQKPSTITDRYLYNGKEKLLDLDLGWSDYGARMYMSEMGRWGAIDPLAENLHNLSLSTYCFTANNPINNIDPDGRDWYTNNETGNYTWYKGKEEREGYTYVGGKNSALGEFESKINTILTKTFKVKGGLYSEGFTFDIVDKDKGGLLPVDGKGGGNFLDEFVNGTGPEFFVFLENHPYTEEMKTESLVKKSQKLIAEGKTDVKGQRTKIGSGFGLLGYLTSFSMAEQFIGSYRLDIFTSKDGKNYNNIISDSKSKSSLFYNADVADKRRSEMSTPGLGTTYQFYIWKSSIKK